MGEIFRAERPRPSMAHTGERLSAGHSLETEVEHFHRYYMARAFCRDARVLDIACGEGYGSALLAQVAASVIGVDVDADAVAHAGATYGDLGPSFRHGSATAIPVADGTIDVLVSFETLEHFVDHDAFMAEARRVLRPGGKLILSTPDRDVFSPLGTPPTEYHVHELSRAEFRELLGRHFAHCSFYSQRVLVGSAILRDEGGPTGVPPLVFERRDPTRIESSAGIPRARYLICIASDANDEAGPGGLFIESDRLADPTGRSAALEATLEQARQAHRAELATLQAAHDALIERIDQDRRSQVAEIERQGRETAADARRDGEAAGEATADELRGQLTRLHQDRHRLWEDAAAAQGRLTDSSAVVARVRAELADSRWHERDITRRYGEAQAEADRLAARLAQSQQAAAERDAILRSTSWRALGRLHAVASRHPKAARLARSGAKLGWRIVTRQLGPRRRAREQHRSDLALLAATPLFDRAWYLRRYPAVAASGADPLAHYLWVGAATGHDPHPLFDTAWYAATYAVAAGRNPLAHYLTAGQAAGHDPHPLFDTRHFRATGGPARRTALEDYLDTPVAGPVGQPNPLFDPRLYAAEHPAVAASGLDPLIHYATIGAAAGLAPHPLFDPDWYADRYTPAGGPAGTLAHYLRHGRQAGHAPCALALARTAPLPESCRFPLPTPEAPDVSIIVPAYAHLFDTYRCLCTVAWNTAGAGHEVLLADDRPDAPIAPLLTDFPGLRATVNRINLGFLRSCNEAARRARGRHLVFLNNDTEVGPDWLAPMVRLADADPAVGMVGCKLLNPDGTIQEAGGIFRDDGWGEPYGKGAQSGRGEYNFVRQVDCVTGACFLVPRRHWDAVGGLDDDYAPAFYEEFDLAVALQQAGLRVMYQPASEVTHLGSASYGAEIRDRQSTRNHARFCRKWQHYLAGRPSRRDSLFRAREARVPLGVALVIDDRMPEPDRHAGGLTLFQYLDLLQRMGLKVVYSPDDPTPFAPYTANLQQRGIEVVHAPDSLSDWLARNGREVDHVWISRPTIARLYLDELRRETGAPIYYYTHDLHYLREQRRFRLEGDWWAREQSVHLRELEFATFAAVDVVMSPSAEEAAIIRHEVPVATARTIPPYLFASQAAPAPIPAEQFAPRHDIVFVGGYAHLPNVDAALWLARDIFPLIAAEIPEARLVVLGSDPPPEVLALAGGAVVVPGYVPDLAPFYDAARMSLSPLRYGAGVKGKVVSSLQAGVPVVTTPVGAEGIGLRDGIDALVADDAAGIAACAVRLLRDPALCATLAEAGGRLVHERFSTEAARTAMRELFLPG